MIQKLTTLFLFVLLAVQAIGQTANSTINLQDLEGKWLITHSNFPMWLKGNKTSPTFNYTLVHEGGMQFLLDSVQFIKNGKQKSINGIDHALNSDNTAFIWRGNGILKILKSKWKILYLDASNDWAIIFFEKTLFTPEGYDVIARRAKISEAKKRVIQEQLDVLGITALTEIKHE